ncbi:hypothetical protein PanWU01x14_086960 [Parasponia andersonii]|uniref:Uncharacterized protein n=1 Tax=Parasponia andersonii TaxID=3476 RepID=A0A2P5D8D4_PARAD|nr:hypothetical protein PanWU01x14_086960 [Parasponia andersonii]
MGGNSRQKKSSSSASFSVFNLFKLRRTRRSEEDHCPMQDNGPIASSRVWPRDEDRVRWVAEPGIDRKAEDFIAKIHRNIATDSERKTFNIPSTSTSTSATSY